MRTLTLAVVLVVLSASRIPAGEMPRVVVSKDRKGFALEPSGKAFVPWGVNYDHDAEGRLLEDYWDAEWEKVERDFKAAKALGRTSSASTCNSAGS